MTTMQSEILGPEGKPDPGALCRLLEKIVVAGDVQQLGELLDVVATRKPESFEEKYQLFGPVLFLLARQDANTMPSGFSIAGAVKEWATRLDLMQPEHLNAMLAQDQGLVTADWLISNGADPNAVLDPKSPEKLTVIGHVCRTMQDEGRDEDTVRDMIFRVVSRGDLPYSVKPGSANNAQGCDLFEALMTDAHGAGWALNVMLEAVKDCVQNNPLPQELGEAFGRVCADSEKVKKCLASHMGESVGYRALAYSKLPDTVSWKVAFDNFGTHAGAEYFFSRFARRLGVELVKGVSHNAVDIDQVTTSITADDIPCTLLQAAAFLGDERSVRALIEAGADPAKTVGAGSEHYPIADLDAKRLWERNPEHGRSEVLDAAAAKTAIDSVIRKAQQSGKQAPIGGTT